MTVYNWSALTNNQAIAFNSAVDRLSFDDTTISGSNIGVRSIDTASVIFSYGGKTVTLAADVRTLTNSNVNFSSGSAFLVGDNSTGVSLDSSGNLLNGSVKDDFIIGLGGADTINAGAGNDQIDENGNLVNAIIDGGLGYDILTIHPDGTPVSLTSNVRGIEYFILDPKNSSSAQNLSITNGAFNDVIGAEIKVSNYTSALVDGSSVSVGNLQLHGSWGNDTLLGGAGNDYINGHRGSDIIDGGGGVNTAGFSLGQITRSVISNINLSKGVGQTWTISSGSENWFTIYKVSENSDALSITDLRTSNQVSIDGDLFGSITLSNIQTLGFDADYLDINNTAQWYRALSVNVTGTGSTLTLNLVNKTMMGTSGNDLLLGATIDETFLGLGGADSISAGAGNDYIDESGNLVGASIDGGAGWDNLTIHTNGAAVVLGANIKGIEQFSIDPSNSASIQNVTITNDVYRAMSGATIYVGTWNGSTKLDASAITAGNLNLSANSGNDTLLGGVGNDYLNGHGGNDSIDGGGGQNTAGINLGRISASDIAGIALVKGVGQNWTISSGGVSWFSVSQISGSSNTLNVTDLRASQATDSSAPGTTTISNIQTIGFEADYIASNNITQWYRAFNITVTGSGSSIALSLGNKTIIGTSNNDVLIGTSGDDNIIGLGGSDTISAGTGNDQIDEIGNLLGVNIDGGLGWDNVTVHPDGSQVTLGANVRGIENFNIAGNNSTVIQNVVLTNAAYSAGENSNIGFNAWSGVFKIDASAVTVGTVNVATSSNDDVLIGGAGNDDFNGRGGNDTIDGGGGVNTARYILGQIAASDLSSFSLVKGAGQIWMPSSGGISLFSIAQSNANSDALTITDLRSSSQIAPDGDASGIDRISNIQTIGFDADYLDANNNQSWFRAFNINVNGTGSSLSLTLSNKSVVGTSGKDVIAGTAFDDTILGLGGADTINAGDGDDNIDETGNLFDVMIDGGTGWDHLMVHTNGKAVVLGSNVKSIEHFNIDGQNSVSIQSVTLLNEAYTGRQGANFIISNLSGPSVLDASTVTVGSVDLHGGSYNDTLLGSIGNDYINGHGGNDFIDGGLGRNTAAFNLGRLTASAMSKFALIKGTGQNWSISSDGVDLFRISQASTNSDTLTVTDLRSSIQIAQDSEALGTDTLNNIQTIGFDADYLDANNNTSWFRAFDINVSGTGPSLALILANKVTVGSLGADSIIGTSGDDVIRGLGGADTISAGAGSDSIDETGNLFGSSIDGGSGSDSLTLHTSGAAVTLGANIKGIEEFNIDTNNSVSVQSISISNDAYSGMLGSEISINIWNATPLKFDAGALTAGTVNVDGGVGADSLIGGSGNDRLKGNGGNDTIKGASGNDRLDGGDGIDVAVYTGNKSQYSLKSNGANTYFITDLRSGSPDGSDIITNFEVLRFADGDTDFLWASPASSVGVHVDINTSLNGYNMFGSPNLDDLTGNANGATTVIFTSYNSSSASRSFEFQFRNPFSATPHYSLGGASFYGQPYVASGAIVKGYLDNINLGGPTDIPGAINTPLSDSQLVQWLMSSSGIHLTEFSDIAFGSSDGLNPNGSNFVFDTISHLDIDMRIMLGDGLSTVMSNGDVISGNSGNDILYGYGGDDTINGGDGNDVLYGGAGNDYLNGGLGDDTYMLTELTGGNDTISDSGGTNDIVVWNNDPAYVYVDASRSGTNNTNLIVKTYLDGVLKQTTTIIGEYASSFTAASPSTAIEKVYLPDQDLTLFVINGLIGNSASPDNELIIGTSSSEVLTGNGGVDHLYGGDGNDTLNGGDGNDLLVGGLGDDSLNGGLGDDTYMLTELTGGNDTISDSGGLSDLVVWNNDPAEVYADLSRGGPSNTSLIIKTYQDGVVKQTTTIVGEFAASVTSALPSTAIEKVYLPQDDRTLFIINGLTGNNASPDNELIVGTSSSEVLTGNGGIDFVYGGDGNDTMNGGDGDDILFGGAGSDTAVYRGVSAQYVITLQSNGTYTVRDTVAGRDGVDVLSNIDFAQFSDQAVRLAPQQLVSNLHGIDYFWKANASGQHALLSGVTVNAQGGTQPAEGANAPIQFKNITWDSAGHATVDVYAHVTTAVDSIQVNLGLGSATNATFTSSMTADWTLLGNMSGGEYVIGGYSMTALATGDLKLGTLTFDTGAASQMRLAVDAGSTLGSSTTSGALGTITATPYGYTLAHATSGADGVYTMTAIDPGIYALTATRSTSDIGTAITSADALAALKIAVGMNPNPGTGASQLGISPFQIMSADANQDGKVTSADALAILKMAVHMSNALTPEWMFVEETRDLSGLSRTTAAWDHNMTVNVTGVTTDNLVGFVKGDVNGSWTPPAGTQYVETMDPSHFTNLNTTLHIPMSEWGVL